MNEELIVAYHTGVSFAAKCSMLLKKQELEELRGRFIAEAARSSDEDRLALQLLARICEAYTLEDA